MSDINLTDPNAVADALASASGQQAVLDVLSVDRPELWHLQAPMPIARPGAPHQPMALPWPIIAPHAKQAPLNFRNSANPEAPGKSLEFLRDNGGISAAEAVAIIEERPFEEMDEAAAFERLAQLVATASGS
jgi:hypothetical protein